MSLAVYCVFTGARFLCSIALLFCPALSPSFFVLYLAAGLTDIIDGAVARSTNTVSAFGARLDSLADIMFVSVCIWKLLPVAELKYSAPLVCTAATFAAIQEGHFIRTGREN